MGPVVVLLEGMEEGKWVVVLPLVAVIAAGREEGQPGLPVEGIEEVGLKELKEEVCLKFG